MPLSVVNAAPVVPCSCCGGSGFVQLTGVYADTLALLRRQREEVTGASLSALARCKPTAMNNRLAALERMGLAASRRYGRVRLYRAKEAPGAT